MNLYKIVYGLEHNFKLVKITVCCLSVETVFGYISNQRWSDRIFRNMVSDS